MQEDGSRLRIERAVQTLHARSETQAFLCDQETVDSSESRQSAPHIQKNGGRTTAAQRFDPTHIAAVRRVICGRNIDSDGVPVDHFGAQKPTPSRAWIASLPIRLGGPHNLAAQRGKQNDLGNSDDQEQRLRQIQVRIACKSGLRFPS